MEPNGQHFTVEKEKLRSVCVVHNCARVLDHGGRNISTSMVGCTTNLQDDSMSDEDFEDDVDSEADE